VCDAAVEACGLRFPPIAMTSFALILGVVPFATTTGASMNSQRAIGTSVGGGMITAPVLAVCVTLLSYGLVATTFRRTHGAEALSVLSETPDFAPRTNATSGAR
jgi:multidrug efflux pump subunit AcrB